MRRFVRHGGLIHTLGGDGIDLLNRCGSATEDLLIPPPRQGRLRRGDFIHTLGGGGGGNLLLLPLPRSPGRLRYGGLIHTLDGGARENRRTSYDFGIPSPFLNSKDNRVPNVKTPSERKQNWEEAPGQPSQGRRVKSPGGEAKGKEMRERGQDNRPKVGRSNHQAGRRKERK